MIKLNNKFAGAVVLAIAACSLRLCAGWFDDGFASSGYAAGGAEYLKLPVHARTGGLEAATVAWSSGLAGLQYNPAILDAADSIAICGTNSFMSYDYNLFGADAVCPIRDLFVAGLGVTQLSVGKIAGRDEFGMATGGFSSSFNAINAALAGRLSGLPVSLGLRGRYIFETIEKEHSNGMGFDVGAAYQPIKQLCVGASIQNMLSYVWWSTSRRDKVLTTGRLGVCGILLDRTLRMELDLVKTLEQPEEAAFGAEYRFLDYFMARAGIRSAVITATGTVMKPELSFGAGMRYSFLGFDYAIIIPPPPNDLGVVHQISITGKLRGLVF